jgi:hypothetical protein
MSHGTRATVGNEINLTDHQFGDIYVDKLAGRNPTRYHVTCLSCGSRWATTVELLRNDPKCQNGVCRRKSEDAERARARGYSPSIEVPLEIDPRTFDLYKEMQAQRDERLKQGRT